jgi:hypothetical protein
VGTDTDAGLLRDFPESPQKQPSDVTGEHDRPRGLAGNRGREVPIAVKERHLGRLHRAEGDFRVEIDIVVLFGGPVAPPSASRLTVGHSMITED